jgi:hypothetical protein
MRYVVPNTWGYSQPHKTQPVVHRAKLGTLKSNRWESQARAQCRRKEDSVQVQCAIHQTVDPAENCLIPTNRILTMKSIVTPSLIPSRATSSPLTIHVIAYIQCTSPLIRLRVPLTPLLLPIFKQRNTVSEESYVSKIGYDEISIRE